jgi:hypothetical protein
MKTALARLQHLCNTIPSLLHEIDEDTFSHKPSPGKWSKKEIMGHLIDSATNNHHRFVRGQFEACPVIAYDPDKWNEFGYYQQMDRMQIVDFWTIYNRQLIALARAIPTENWQKECETTDRKRYTLEFLWNDYVEHLEHHLREIIAY